VEDGRTYFSNENLESSDSNLASSIATGLASFQAWQKLTILLSWDPMPGTPPLMPHYLGKLIAL
jgi:hypothetical protein